MEQQTTLYLDASSETFSHWLEEQTAGRYRNFGPVDGRTYYLGEARHWLDTKKGSKVLSMMASVSTGGPDSPPWTIETATFRAVWFVIVSRGPNRCQVKAGYDLEPARDCYLELLGEIAAAYPEAGRQMIADEDGQEKRRKSGPAAPPLDEQLRVWRDWEKAQVKGTSQSAFCQLKGISESTLRNYRRRLKAAKMLG